MKLFFPLLCLSLIKVQASDGGTPILVSTQTLTVLVTDINDNTPFFINDPYNFAISEAASLGTIAGTIAAGDADINNNGLIGFSINDVKQVC